MTRHIGETRSGRASIARGIVFSLLLACHAGGAWAHQIDEYVGVTHVEIQRDRIRTLMSLTPGSEVAASVISAIDTNKDGMFSAQESQYYAQAMAAGITISVDRTPLPARLVDVTVPAPDVLRTGQAIIRMTLDVTPPPQEAGPHAVEVANVNQALTVIVANALIPPDPRVRIRQQNRDQYQRHLEISYDVTPPSMMPWVVVSLLGVGAAGALMLWTRRRAL